MTPRNFDDFILRDLERDLAHHERSLAKQQQAQKPPAAEPTAKFLAQVPDQPLSWLWPGRIPLGHLTLLDAAPGSGLSLLALSLAACVSSGSPLPDGTPTQQGNVLLLAPYDSPTDILKPRLQAAGGDPSHLVLVCPLVVDASRTFARSRSYAFPQDLDHLGALIRSHHARLLIIDPASAIPGLVRCLPALVDLARQTTCAILLTRSLGQPPANPLHATGPTSALLQASRSRLLLAPDPSDDSRQLLLTTKHALGTQPDILAYHIVTSEAGVPTIHWLGKPDHDQLTRLSTGPIRSPYRQAILHFLQHNDAPQSIPDILAATSYDREAGRRMLLRMKMAGELVSPARGLYTTAHHPCLLHFTEQSSPVPNIPNVANVSTVPSSPHTTPTNPLQKDVANVANVSTVPSPPHPTPANPLQEDVANVATVPSPPHTTPTNPLQKDVANVANVSTVPSPPHPKPANPLQENVANVATVPSSSHPKPANPLQENVANVSNPPY